MTPYQKLQHLILSKAAMRGEIELGEVTPENIDDLWDEYEERAKRTIAKHEAEFEFPQPDADGWIPWNGIRQVPPWMTPLDTVIIKSRNGAVDGPHLPRNLDWKHRGCKFDIIAYRIVTT